MNKLIKPLLVISFCLILISINFSQLFCQINEQPCDPCIGTPWSPVLSMGIDADIHYGVKYKKKYCNGEWVILITEVTLETPSVSDMCKIFGVIIMKILNENPMYIPPYGTSDGVIRWKILREVCWHYVNSSNTVLVPCGTDCCETIAEVRILENCSQITTNIISEKGGAVKDCPIFGIDQQKCGDICLPTKIPTTR